MIDFTQTYINYRPFLFWTATLTPGVCVLFVTTLYFWAKHRAGTLRVDVIADSVRFGVPIIITATLITAGITLADNAQLKDYNQMKIEQASERTGQISRTIMSDNYVEYMLDSGHIIRIDIDTSTDMIDTSGRPGDVIIYKQYTGVDTMHALYLKYEQKAKIVRIVSRLQKGNGAQHNDNEPS